MLGPSLWDGSEKLFWEHQKGGEGKGNHKNVKYSNFLWVR